MSADDIAAVAGRFRHDRRVAAAIQMLFLRASGRPMDRFASVHQLQRAIHGGQLAPERGRRKQEMAAISGAHALLTNMVLAWNTNRMDGVVARLKRDGVGIEKDWLRRIGPAHFSHINFRGTFRFNVERYADVLVERAAGKTTAKSAQ
jgi:Tn3 transposase DDE domain